jgi:hypothetical protein
MNKFFRWIKKTLFPGDEKRRRLEEVVDAELIQRQRERAVDIAVQRLRVYDLVNHPVIRRPPFRVRHPAERLDRDKVTGILISSMVGYYGVIDRDGKFAVRVRDRATGRNIYGGLHESAEMAGMVATHLTDMLYEREKLALPRMEEVG